MHKIRVAKIKLILNHSRGIDLRRIATTNEKYIFKKILKKTQLKMIEMQWIFCFGWKEHKIPNTNSNVEKERERGPLHTFQDTYYLYEIHLCDNFFCIHIVRLMQRRQKITILLNELKRIKNWSKYEKKLAKHARKITDNNLCIFVSLRTHRPTKWMN